jgi:hypothetical protein
MRGSPGAALEDVFGEKSEWFPWVKGEPLSPRGVRHPG